MNIKKWIVRFTFGILLVIFTVSFALAQESLYDKALKAYAKKDFKTSAKYLSEYVEKKPDPYAYYLLGYASYKLKNHTAAMKYFNDAYVIDPDFTPPPLETKK